MAHRMDSSWTEGELPPLPIPGAARSKSREGPVSDNLCSVIQKCRQRARKSNSCLQTDGKTRSTAELSIRVPELGERTCGSVKGCGTAGAQATTQLMKVTEIHLLCTTGNIDTVILDREVA